MGQSLVKLARQRPLQKTDQNIEYKGLCGTSPDCCTYTTAAPIGRDHGEVGMGTVKARGTGSTARLCHREMSDYTHKVLPTWLPKLDSISPSGSSSPLTAIICQMKTVSGWTLQLSDRLLL